MLQVLREDGSADPASDPPLGDAERRALFEHMLRLRHIDERMTARQRQGRIGFWGAVTGQEAPPIATAMALTPRDWIFPALREGAAMLVRGFPLTAWLAQAYGNERDVLRGRQMPSHPSGRAVNQVAWSSCIGPQLPQAVGAAYASKLRGDGAVTVAFLGDGATSQGDFHDALTFAGVWRVPCVFVCQNNQWAISVPTSRQTASATLAVKAGAYGLPGTRLDGNDALAVYAGVGAAVDRARRGEGATLIEAVTYRIGPHSSSDDPGRYRAPEEVEAWRTRDPIIRMERHLRHRGLLDDASLDAMRRAIDREIESALAEIQDLPPPPRASLFDDVYAERPPHLQKQARGSTPRS